MSVILTVGVLFSFFFRTPLGNILSAVGKADWNVAHSVFWLIAFIPLSVFGYHAWGMLGIAASICCVFIISGFISLVMFFFYLKNIQLESSKGISS
jgi:O-antigen/teichoic acid export membrane protein